MCYTVEPRLFHLVEVDDIRSGSFTNGPHYTVNDTCWYHNLTKYHGRRRKGKYAKFYEDKNMELISKYNLI